LVAWRTQILTRSLKEYALAAEIVGAIAVVISLIYVGTSVNQNTDAILVANHQALVAMDQNTNSWFRDSEFAFRTHRSGMMEDDIWEGWDAYYRSQLEEKGYQWFWNTAREGFSPAFRVYVDSILAEIE
jgi:hypothetical protein